MRAESIPKNKKILLVEDSRLTTMIIAEFLHKNGYETETAVTGEDAVQKISGGFPPDLVLMDIELAGEMDGIEAARRIIKSRDIPIVFLTANTSGEIIDKIKEVKAYGFVLKGMDKAALLSTVEMALKLHEANTQARMFERLFENSLNELYIFHPKSLKFVAVNRAARKNLGYTMEELSTMTPLDIKPELDLQSFRELLAPLVSGEQEQVLFNTVHRRKGGSLYPVEINLQIFDYGGEKLCLALVVDLTERRAMEEGLEEKEATLSAIMEAARDAIVMLDGQGNVTFWNPAAEQLFGYSREEILGKDLHRLLVPDEHLYEVYSQAFQRLNREGNAIRKTFELKAKHKDGRELDVELSLSALRIMDALHAVGIVRDISERKKTEERLYRLSITDTLTNAYNRRYFMQVLEQEIERSRRTGLSFSVIMADLDHFKDINDRFGHATGDRVLKSFVDMIQQRIRKTDCLARWGGEEFIILLTNIPVEKAADLAEELRERLSQMDIPGVGRVNASFGVAGYCPGDTVDTLIMRADNTLYEAKSSGRNCVRFTGACI